MLLNSRFIFTVLICLLLTTFNSAVSLASIKIETVKIETIKNSPVSYHPQRFLDFEIQKLKAEFLVKSATQTKNDATAPITASTNKITLNIAATRNEFLKQLYAHDLVEAGPKQRALSDKLIMAQLLQSYIGPKFEFYHPKTLGLKAFMLKYKLVDKKNNLLIDHQKWQTALQNEFAHGVIFKPAAGINSQGKSKGFYFKIDKFLADLFRPDTDLYKPEDMTRAFSSELLRGVTSGEYLILQENVVTAAGSQKVLQTKEFREVRVHTFESKVVEGATFRRWKEMKKLSETEIKLVNAFVQEFLDLLPHAFLNKQAWGLDVALMDNGVMRIIDINTNRGESIQWSGFMSYPQTLGAYTRHLEAQNKIELAGFSGVLMRHNYGNVFKHLKKYYIDGIQ